jgi:hypothetical protein
MKNYKEIVDKSMKFDGMTTIHALRLMTFFLRPDLLLAESSSMIEFGTYKGRVSSLLGQCLRDEESLILVDVRDYLDHTKMNNLSIDYTHYLAKSEDWCLVDDNNRKFSFSHHDASHFFTNVQSELLYIDKHMDISGVIVLDDFSDPFNQVRAAYFHSRYSLDLEFELILIGFGKAFLVHSSVFDVWERKILMHLNEHMSSLSSPVTLFRTDIHKLSRSFSVALKKQPTDDDLYGLNTWGNKFYKLR